MAFIIHKQSTRHGKTRELYYLVENYREGKQIKRRKLLNLNECKTLAELLLLTDHEKVRVASRLKRCEKDLDDFIQYQKLPPLFIYRYPSEIVRRLTARIEQVKVDLAHCQSKMEEIKRYFE